MSRNGSLSASGLRQWSRGATGLAAGRKEWTDSREVIGYTLIAGIVPILLLKGFLPDRHFTLVPMFSIMDDDYNYRSDEHCAHLILE